MIVEHAYLHVLPGEEARFEAVLAEAAHHMAAAEGFRGLEVRRCIEHGQRYLLLVTWDSVEAHMEGFRSSELYAKWRALLLPFYASAPEVEHYGAPVVTRAASRP